MITKGRQIRSVEIFRFACFVGMGAVCSATDFNCVLRDLQTGVAVLKMTKDFHISLRSAIVRCCEFHKVLKYRAVASGGLAPLATMGVSGVRHPPWPNFSRQIK